MTYFAKVENGLVTEVVSADKDVIDSGILGDPALFVQTSYRTQGGVHYGPDGHPDGPGLRKNYASVGYIYDSILDAFIPPKPYPSWLLNTQSCLWEAPVPYPDNGNMYVWDEDTISWAVNEN